ncbi:MAG: DNA polymerase III subunit gamma/tau [Anaerovoracaceae bacterium]|nr:DNA polymerase III subunit gamma/tau [Bacillota bacterium]MDY2671014.1 DNA polymerase III subunit gamma/tau [Anaerovoracaceae bacterium]
MHQALYREFRPSRFEELIGQDHIVRILKSQIASGSTSHAYLFSGTRGTGKTTTARILAKALNCTGEGEKPCGVCDNCRAIAEGSFIDVIEIDAASNNGVDNIRDLTDSVMYAPTVGKYKVYIIDEVHMLSQGAFNALLKTLEEPPEYVVFILATTEPQKVPATILSRCMRLDFRRVSEKALVENMRRICDAKGIEAEDGALSLIAVNADGSVRDSLSILEQCICPGEPLRRDDAAAVLGTAGEESLLKLTDCVIDSDTSGALLMLNNIINSGADVRSFMKEWLEHFRNLLLARYVDKPGDMLNMSDENAARLIAQAGRVSQDFLDRAVRELTGTISETRWSPRPRVMLEMSIVKLSQPQDKAAEAVVGPQSGQAAQRQATAPSVQAGAGRVQAQPQPRPRAATPDPAPAPQMAAEPQPAVFEEDPYIDQYQDIPPWEELSPAPEPDVSAPVRQEEAAAPAGAEAAKPQPVDQAAGGFSEMDWREAVEAAASQHGMFSRLNGRTHLVGADGDMIRVSCDDDNTETMLRNRAKAALEEIIEKQMGKHFSIDIVKKNMSGNGGADADRQREELEAFFGRSVDIN